MLLTAEDGGSFEATLVTGPEVKASYRVKGRVEDNDTEQTDAKIFASEDEARNWLNAEANKRGFKGYRLDMQG